MVETEVRRGVSLTASMARSVKHEGVSVRGLYVSDRGAGATKPGEADSRNGEFFENCIAKAKKVSRRVARVGNYK